MQPPDRSEPASEQAALADVVTLALKLSSADQAQLASLLLHLAGNQATAPTSSESAAPTVDEWLRELAAHSGRDQVLLIDQALVDADPQTASQLVEVRDQVLRADPVLGLRLAVESVARQHPFACVVGVLGLGLAVASAGRGLFRLAF